MTVYLNDGAEESNQEPFPFHVGELNGEIAMRSILNKLQYSSRSCAARAWIAMLVTIGSLATLAFAQSSYVPPFTATATNSLYKIASGNIGEGQIAVDKLGDVFMVGNNVPAGPDLYEIPHTSPVTATTTPVPLVTGFGQYTSYSVSVDPNGNLWLMDGGGLDEFPALNGIPNVAAIPAGETLTQVESVNCTVPATVPCHFTGMASNISGGYASYSYAWVDASENAYLVDSYDVQYGSATTRIVKVNLSNPGTGQLLATVPTAGNSNAELTIAGDGNIYYVDNYNGSGDGYPPGGGSGNVYQISGWTSTTPGTVTLVGNTATIAAADVSKAVSVSTDPYGNLIIIGWTQISEVPLEGTTLNFADEFNIPGVPTSPAPYYPFGAGTDAYGNYYYDTGSIIEQVQLGGYNFGPVNVGTHVTHTSPASSPSPIFALYFNTAETISKNGFPTGSPTTDTSAALLQSFPQDATSSNTLTAPHTYAAAATAKVNADFQPIHAGLLKGSYTALNSSNGIIETINVQGVGAGPQPMFLPGVASSLFTSAATSSTVSTPINLNGPSGIAVDTFGDIFVADPGNGRVVADCLASTATAAANSFCTGAGYTGATVGLGTSFTTPAGIALDGANSLYVVDSAANTVTMIQGGTGVSSTLVAATNTFGGAALSGPKGIALDGSANVYIADTGNNRIVEAHQYGAAATTNIVYVPSTTAFGGTTLNGPTGMALDASGDLFIADTGNNRIVEYSIMGAASVVATTGVTLSAPTGVAVLPSGGLIVTDATNDVSLISGGNGTALSFSNTSTGTPLTISKAVGVALDLSGNIYAADALGDQVVELNVSSPAAAPGFPITAPGGTSTSDDTTELLNIGNATLSLSAAPALDAGDTNFGLLGTGTCTNGATVTASESCTLVTDFTPQIGGALTGTVTLTDNQLGYTVASTTPNRTGTFLASGTQTIALSGTGEVLPTAPTPTFSPAAGTFATAQTVTISDSVSGAAIYYTTNGTLPTAGSTLYSAPVTVSLNETLEAIAVASGYSVSSAGSAAYTINSAPQPAATPTFSPAAGSYTAAQSVTISDATAGAAIYYTNNGSTPTTASTLYTGSAIPVIDTETISAIAVATGYTNSAVATAAYTINQISLQSYVPPIVASAATTLFNNNGSQIGRGQMTADKAGNVFFVGNGVYSGSTLVPDVYEIPHTTPAATTTTPVPIFTGLGQYSSYGMSLDPNGNLWLLDGSTLVELPGSHGIPNTSLIPSGGDSLSAAEGVNCTVPATVPCKFSGLAGNLTGGYAGYGSVSVDALGNVYLLDVGDNVSHGAYNRIFETTLSNPGTGTVLADNIGTTANANAQIALAGDGNLYYVDNYDSPGYPPSGSGVVSLVSGGTLTAVGNTATNPSAEVSQAVNINSDAYGNLIILGATQLSEVPLEGTTLNFADEFGILKNTTSGVTYYGASGTGDSNGNYYYNSGPTIVQLQLGGYNFGTVNVGSEVMPSSMVPAPTLNLFFNANETVAANGFPTGSPDANTNAALLQGFPEDSSTSLTAGSSFVPGNTASVVADFQPIHSGLLKGSYTPVSSGGGIEATVNLQGVGSGPQPMFLPGVASSLFTSAATSSTVATPINLNAPSGIAVDTLGDIFVADPGNGRVVADCLASTATATGNSFCAGAGYAGKTVGLGTGFITPAGIALDGANSLYVVDSAANTVTVIQGGNGASSTLVAAANTFGGTGLSAPKGIALDGYANVYIADTGNNRIVKAHQFGATATNNIVYVPSTTTFGGTTLSGPTGVAVDASGDLFIADTGNNRIVEYSIMGAASVVATSGVTLSAPTGVAVLPSGGLIVTDATNDVSLISGGNGSALSFSNTSSGTPLTIGKAVGVALDLSGNIYAADTLGDQVVELNVSSPAAAPGFPAISVGSTSASDDTTEVFNSGNATLSLSAAPALDFGDTNFGILGTGTCTNSATVTANESCTLVTDFTPQSGGVLTGTVTLTDNQLGYTLTATTPNETASFLASGTQTIALSGSTSTSPAATPTFSPASGTYTTIQSVTISDTTSGATIYYTTNGTAPTTGSTPYSGPITVSSTETIEAIAIASGYSQSAAVTAAYTINLPAATPSFSPAAGTYASAQSVTISDTIIGSDDLLHDGRDCPVDHFDGLLGRHHGQLE